jgi:hypothetical protein
VNKDVSSRSAEPRATGSHIDRVMVSPQFAEESGRRKRPSRLVQTHQQTPSFVQRGAHATCSSKKSAGLTIPQAAEVLGISIATAERYWTYARTWLYCALNDPGIAAKP